MRGHGRSVLSFLVAAAVLGVLAPAASAGHERRSSDYDRGWQFALVNPADITDPTGAYAGRGRPRLRRLVVARRSTCRTTGASSSTPDHRAPAPPAAPASSTAASAGTASRFTLPARLAGKRISRRVRRRLHGLGRLPQRHAGRRRTPTATPASSSTSPTCCTPTAHAERHRRPGQQQAAQQPLVLGQRHLPQRPPGRHRPGPRRSATARSSRRRRRRARTRQGFASVARRHGRRRRPRDRRGRRPSRVQRRAAGARVAHRPVDARPRTAPRRSDLTVDQPAALVARRPRTATR